ncbi:hypothetical protein HZC00_02035 [Candidatus Kaiserbacteria bacterium]|nr:hypothetical protein [Candidatus Kaiserbacteria bacterium]
MATSLTNSQEILQTTSAVQLAPTPQQGIPPTIQIDTVQALFGLAVILIGAGIAWGTLRNSLKNVSRVLTENISPDLKDVRERFMVVEDRVETLWKDKFAPSHSPRQLNDRGRTILDISGIKEIVESKKETLLEVVRKKGVANPYDAEKAVLDTVAEIPTHCPEVMEELKRGAFKAGADLDTVFLVGGIHLRNLIFPTLGFDLNDLDKPKT